MSLYTIELLSPTGQLLADISHLCTTRSYVVRRNRAEDIYLTLNLEKAQDLARDLGLGFFQLFAGRINEVRITRGNRPLVGGKLMVVHPRLNQDGSTLELRASGFLSLLDKVYLEAGDTTLQSYTNTDMGALAWAQINGIQQKTNGNFGFTQGVIQPSRNISENYKPYASSVAEMLVELSDRDNGIDFEFTPDKVFNVYYPGIGGSKPELLFNYPGNIKSLGAPQDGTTLANISYNIGSGNGQAQVGVTTTNLDSAATYGRSEQVNTYPSINVAATLTDKGNETVRLYGLPMMIPEVTLDGSQEPFLGSYWIGDRVRISIDTDRYPAFALLDGQDWRINEISVQVDDNDHEDITLKVGYS